jgi:hypothetical protein
LLDGCYRALIESAIQAPRHLDILRQTVPESSTVPRSFALRASSVLTGSVLDKTFGGVTLLPQYDFSSGHRVVEPHILPPTFCSAHPIM